VSEPMSAKPEATWTEARARLEEMVKSPHFLPKDCAAIALLLEERDKPCERCEVYERHHCPCTSSYLQDLESERDKLRAAYQPLAADLAPGGGPEQVHAALHALMAEKQAAEQERDRLQAHFVDQNLRLGKAEAELQKAREILGKGHSSDPEDMDTASCIRCGNFMNHRGGDGYECDPCAQELLGLVREALSPFTVPDSRELEMDALRLELTQARWLLEKWVYEFPSKSDMYREQARAFLSSPPPPPKVKE
jgi:hypothetical protein